MWSFEQKYNAPARVLQVALEVLQLAAPTTTATAALRKGSRWRGLRQQWYFGLGSTRTIHSEIWSKVKYVSPNWFGSMSFLPQVRSLLFKTLYRTYVKIWTLTLVLLLLLLWFGRQYDLAIQMLCTLRDVELSPCGQHHSDNQLKFETTLCQTFSCFRSI